MCQMTVIVEGENKEGMTHICEWWLLLLSSKTWLRTLITKLLNIIDNSLTQQTNSWDVVIE